MKKIMIVALLGLTGCGQSSVMATSPGAALPTGLAMCHGNDAGGRCNDWSPHTDQCVNPKGHDVEPMIVPCASIKKPKGSNPRAE